MSVHIRENMVREGIGKRAGTGADSGPHTLINSLMSFP